MSGIGHIGEMQVIEYLEKQLKYAIYLPWKDRGIDFIALKGEKAFLIQVKTSRFQGENRFWFDLSKKKMQYGENIYYILVPYTLSRRIFMRKRKNFLVLPSLHIKKWIDSRKFVTKEGDDDTINVFVYPNMDEETWTYRNKGKEVDLTPYWNNFSDFARF